MGLAVQLPNSGNANPPGFKNAPRDLSPMTELTLIESGGLSPTSLQNLEDCAKTIRNELSEVNRLFMELIPRCTTIGEQLRKAKGIHGRETQAFYAWAEQNFGIKQRQVRSYISFANNIPAIEDKAQAQGIKLTSMEQGLALLAPPKPTKLETDDPLREQMVAAVGRAKGAISRAQDAVLDLVGVSGVDRRHIAAFEAINVVLDSWTHAKPDAEGTYVFGASDTPILGAAVNRQTEEWTEEKQGDPDSLESPTTVDVTPETSKLDSEYDQVEDLEDLAVSQSDDDCARLEREKLPVSEKPGKWTLPQLLFALALCDDNQTRLAKAMGVSKAAISHQLKKKRDAARVTGYDPLGKRAAVTPDAESKIDQTATAN